MTHRDNRAAVSIETPLARAVIAAYRRDDTIEDICDVFGITRTQVADIVKASGVRRGMDTQSMSPADVANLYDILRASNYEIERLRKELHQQQQEPESVD